MMIKDFKENGKFTGPLLVNNVTKGISNKGVPYMNVTLQDSSGTIEGKKWTIEGRDEEVLAPGNIVFINGDVVEYKGNFQLKILSAGPGDDSLKIADFVAPPPIKKELMLEKVYAFIDMIKDPEIALLVSTLVSEHLESFIVFPAATRNHHEYCSGLLHHINGMLDLAKAICTLHSEVNTDLLYAGVILHDLGKVYEFSGPFLPKYTTQGKLIGHISMGSVLLIECAKKLGIEGEKIMLLQHMILAHHGKLEYGSPVVPLTLEAELLFFIDNIDSRINMFNKALRDVQPGEFTPFQFPLEGRGIYKPK